MEQTPLTTDTICAISTPHGVGGIAVARVSGPRAIDITSSIWHGRDLHSVASHTAHLGRITDADGDMLDQAVATVYRAPASFTGDDVVEIAVHGSTYVQSRLIATLIKAGARMAEAGEFTRRAFAAGKMDLAQAEAVADVIAATDRASHRVALNQMRGHYSQRLTTLRDKMVELASLLELELDFSEEDVEFADRTALLDLANEIKAEVDRLAASFHVGSAIKGGIPVAIIGATNAGKSSLLNALLGDDRAIVSDIHGTTRDIVEDTLPLGDYTFRLMDTAGLRHTTDTIESLGIERSLRAASRADIVIHVVDATAPTPASSPTGPDATAPSTDVPTANSTTQSTQVSNADASPVTILVVNKIDLNPAPACDNLPAAQYRVDVSALTGQGIDQLKRLLVSIAAQRETSQQSILVTNARHYQSLLRASESITAAIDSLLSGLSGDLIALDIRLTIDHLSSILGQITSADLLSSIFSRFCIGK